MQYKLNEEQNIKNSAESYYINPNIQIEIIIPEVKKHKGYLFIKRTLDIVLSIIGLILSSWLIIIISIIVKIYHGGPVFYLSRRVGKRGKCIKIIKFRSMKINADKLEDILSPEQLTQYFDEYKLDNDPRVTNLGKFLRYTSIDELPQLWNIFCGDLSIIGPRPIIQSELIEKYGANAAKVISVKPGLSGYWQAYGRNKITYKTGDRQKMELYYIDNMSLSLDFKIFFKTILSVIKRDGAR